MKTAKQLSVFLENKPGHAYNICKTLGDACVNIFTLSLADTNQFGLMRLIVEKPEEAGEILKKSGVIVNLTEVLAVRIDNRPGVLAKIYELLSKENINLEYAYAFAMRRIFLLRVSDNEKAFQVLSGNGLTLLSHEELFSEENEN